MTDKSYKEIAVPLKRAPEQIGCPLLRVREDATGNREMAIGVVYPVQEGVPAPSGSDIIELVPNGNHLVVRTVYEHKKSGGGGWKPLVVSDQTFSSNWAHTFGRESDIN